MKIEKRNQIVQEYQDRSAKIKIGGLEQEGSGELDRIRKRIASSEKKTL